MSRRPSPFTYRIAIASTERITQETIDQMARLLPRGAEFTIAEWTLPGVSQANSIPRVEPKGEKIASARSVLEFMKDTGSY